MNHFYEFKDNILQARNEDINFNFPLHMHICLELLYVEKGSVVLQYNGSEHILNVGDFAIIFPHIIHGYTTVSEKLKYSIAIVSQELLSDFQRPLFNEHPVVPIVPANILPDDIPSLIKELVTLNEKPNSSLLIKSIVSLIFARCLPLLTLTENDAKVQSDITAQVVNYVFEHYNENITLDSVSQALNISRFSVSRIFSMNIKINFLQYVNLIRISRAKEYLTNTDLSIIEISMESGFDSLRTFNRVFKKLTEQTPREYRKQHIT